MYMPQLEICVLLLPGIRIYLNELVPDTTYLFPLGFKEMFAS